MAAQGLVPATSADGTASGLVTVQGRPPLLAAQGADRGSSRRTRGALLRRPPSLKPGIDRGLSAPLAPP